MSDKIRLQKYCSERAICSRRKTEEYIKKGWIKINGKIVTELGTRVDPQKDKVELLKEAQNEKKTFKYLILNKPRGYVSNLPLKGEKEASELLSPIDRKDVHVVGRLDKDSEGLLFFTNDGVVANRLKSPEHNIEKEYEVTIDNELTPEIIKRFQNGLNLAGEKLKPVTVKPLGNKKYQFILREGKNRQIRRMLNKFNHNVITLKRIRIGSMSLNNLKSGSYRSLSKNEISELTKYVIITT